MSLVVDLGRVVTAVSLIRSSATVTENASVPAGVTKLLGRGLENYFGGLTGQRTVVTVSHGTADAPETERQVFRGLGWNRELPPVRVALPRIAIAQLVDCFYGGVGAKVAPEKPLSTSEERFLDRVTQAIAPLFGAAWKSLALIDPKMVAVAGEQSDGAAVMMSIACGEWEAFELTFHYPAATLASLMNVTRADAEDVELAARWDRDLTALVLAVPFPVRTILAEPEVAVSQLTRLAVGDVLPIRVLPQMDLSVAGVRIAKGTVGDHEGRAAFRLD